MASDEINTGTPDENSDIPRAPADSESELRSAWTASAEEELPDIQELTPELVEEEAIRGDFMLRWAAVLLAVLFGFGQISETRTLIHIRSGEAMRAGGFLPPRTDTMSFANAGEPFANISWLLDHVLSLVWAAGGTTGLTLFKALVAGIIAWLLSRISVSGMPTWWSSICCVSGMAACVSDLMPVTDLATLLGLALMLRLLHRAHEATGSGLIWKTPLLIAIWANFDSRAWMGVFALILFSTGSSLVRRQDETTPGHAGPRLWTVTAISVAALFLNPFPLSSALSVVTTYTVEYPVLQAIEEIKSESAALLDGRTEYFSLIQPEVWNGFEFAYVAALTVIVFAAIALSLSQETVEQPWAILLAGFCGLALLTTRELPAAALVATVAAGTAGQRWYCRRFSQEYTLNPSEVLFSRGGRAATVFFFALLGFLVVADRLPTRTPVGLGFTHDLQTTIDSLGKQLDELPADARVLHTRMEHGDVLIWHGRKSFADSRATPFGSPSDPESVTSRYIELRKNLRRNVVTDAQLPSGDVSFVPDTDEVATDEETPRLNPDIDAFAVTHAMVRLSPPGPPDYFTMRTLMNNTQDWTVTSLGASAAVFSRNGSSGKVSGVDKSIDLTRLAFQDAEPVNLERTEFARPTGFYSRYLYRSRPWLSGDLRLARHYLSLQPNAAARLQPDAASLMLAVRSAGSAVVKDPQNARIWFALGLAYSQLDKWEALVTQQIGGQRPANLRYLQAVTALRQALTIQPQITGLWISLMQQYLDHGRFDQALQCQNRALPHLEANAGTSDDPAIEETLQQQYELQDELTRQVEAIETRVDEALSNVFSEIPAEHAAQKLQLAQSIAAMGHLSAAMDVLNENMTFFSEAPGISVQADALRGQLLLETGAAEEAFQIIAQLDAAVRQSGGQPASAPWAMWTATAKIALGSYAVATEELFERVTMLRKTTEELVVIQGSLMTLPLVASVETLIRSDVPTRWPLPHLQQGQIALSATPEAQAEPRFLLAMIHLETGELIRARNTLQGLISECGDTAYRPLAVVYLSQMRDDYETFVQDHTLLAWDAWPEEDFPPDSNSSAQTEDDESQE